jgi:NADH-quinone oxidoreductase subunit L
MALVMTDIKRVLAYSTLSQLGYMMLGVGCGAWTFALYHLITHAFFKCCLFQCSGSVIHAAHHQQDMRWYGGLWRKLPVTAVCFGVCTLAISGAAIPLTAVGISGYYSKEPIIAGAFNYGEILAEHGYWAAPLFYWLPLAVAYVTPFYMARAFSLTFLGEPRDQHLHDHAHEAPWTMLVPQVCLAAMAVLSVPWLLFFWPELINQSREAMAAMMASAGRLWVQPGDLHEFGHGEHFIHAWTLWGFGWALAVGAGLWLYRPGLRRAERIARSWLVRPLYVLAVNKFYFDQLYDAFAVELTRAGAAVLGAIDRYLVDGLVNLAGHVGRGMAWLTGRFDRAVVDAGIDGAANLTRAGGAALRQVHAGRIRTYVTVLFAVLALGLLAAAVWRL